MKQALATSSLYLALVLAVLLLPACEDEPPSDYIPVPYLEGYLEVGEPIRNIIVGISQPITSPFDYSSMMVKDAQVVLSTADRDYDLVYREIDNVGSYYLPDTTVLVQPETKYSIRVRMPDGATMSAETVTPQRISWVIPPRDVLQYPQDTTVLVSPDSLRISWTKGNSPEYLVRARVLDTLRYGLYLQPPTEEINERTNNIPFEDPDDPQFYTSVRWGFVQSNQAPTVWAAFRWYGRNEIAILATDKAMNDWFKATQWGGRSVEYRPEYSNVAGGVGVFGSASVITKEVLLLKRKR